MPIVSAPEESLRVSYSGVRGIVGTTLTPEVARRWGRAFRIFLLRRFAHPTVLIARDTRPSGPELTEALIEGLGELAQIDLGVVPTPTAQFALDSFRVESAVVVTASHNPLQWNGFKFMLRPQDSAGPTGMVLDGPQIKELMALVDGDPEAGAAARASRQDRHAEILQAHREAVLAQIDASKVRSRRFRVAYDSGQGAGRESTLALLESLNCQVFEVNAVRDSEPLPQNLEALCHEVARQNCDLGLAQDLDADRLALVTGRGVAPGEHLTLVLVLEHLLSRSGDDRGRCTVVKNLSTTRAVDDLVERYGARLIEVPVGEVNLSRVLFERVTAGETAFGGEGNGGVIYPPVGLGRDSLMGIALVLEALAIQNVPLSQRLAQLPFYVQSQRKLTPRTGAAEAYSLLEQAFPRARSGREDGLKLILPDRAWLALRPSNTEPIWRLTAEASSRERADELLDEAGRTLDISRPK